jgi:hypothetical protein
MKDHGTFVGQARGLDRGFLRRHVDGEPLSGSVDLLYRAEKRTETSILWDCGN